VLLRFKLLNLIPLGHFLRAIEALAALAAAVGAIREKQKDPKFQKASALGSMNVVAAAERAVSILGIHEHAEFASHSKGIIALEGSTRNRLPADSS
jgi:hypothetical protein